MEYYYDILELGFLYFGSDLRHGSSKAFLFGCSWFVSVLSVFVLFGLGRIWGKWKRRMKRLVFLVLNLVLTAAYEHIIETSIGKCNDKITLHPRPHSVSILEFGAVGDGKTLNTVAFQNAIFYLKSFADKGGAQLYVPAGRWLTGSFNLTSHLTLFLEKGAFLLGSQDFDQWDVVEPLPSYGRGIELPGSRYGGLINGRNLSDVVITGDNGTIDGQGLVWWELFKSRSLNHSRPHLVEFIDSDSVIVSNLTLLNSPAWTIHPVYCSNVRVENITAYSSSESPSTSGIVPDSSNSMCIEGCNISTGGDGIVLKSGWDEYGITYGKPCSNIHIKKVKLQSSSGSGLAFGSEMSGGISNVLVEHVHIENSFFGIEFKTTRGRGGYMKQIFISDVEMENIRLAILASGRCGSHPYERYDPNELPVVNSITFENIVGKNIGVAGKLRGIYESPFSSICLKNVTFSISSESSVSWVCSNAFGFSDSVYPETCDDLATSFSSSSSSCFLLDRYDPIAAL